MVIKKLTKNADPDKCSIGFDSRLEFFFTHASMGTNVVIFEANVNKNKKIK